MEENEIIEEALKAMPTYMAGLRPMGKFDLHHCVEWLLKRVERILRAEMGIRSNAPLSRQHRQELDLALAHFEGPITERVLPIQQSYMKSRMLADINATTAKAALSAAFKTAELKAVITPQRYRAKVAVPLGDKLSLRFYVPYKSLADASALQDKIDAIRQMQDAATRLGYGVVLKQA